LLAKCVSISAKIVERNRHLREYFMRSAELLFNAKNVSNSNTIAAFALRFFDRVYISGER